VREIHIEEHVVDTIRLLIGLRESSFPFEREIRLYQLQTWTYFPDKAKRLVVAGRLAAAKFLERIEQQHAKSLPGKLGSTLRLAALFKIAEYRDLFDAMIAPNGGWLSLLRHMTPRDFDAFVASRHDVAATVADLLDYRYRYLDHGGTDLKLANISHAYVFRFNDRQGGRRLSGSTIRDRWKLQKQSAVFVYVSKKTNFEFFPPKVAAKSFLDRLTHEVSNHSALTTYFGKCA
jgi:hypothetical protein